MKTIVTEEQDAEEAFLLAQKPSAEGETLLDDQAWASVLTAVDRTYAELVEHQNQLERQNTELDELRTFLLSVLSSVSDVLIVVSLQGKVQECSASLSKITHRDKKNLMHSPAKDLVNDATRAAFHEGLEEVFRTRESLNLEVSLITPVGHMPLELNISAITDDRNRAVGCVLTGRPLGELRQAYDALEVSHGELKAAQAQLVRNEKLASLGRLLAGVAHELNNPISFVYANAHAIEKYVGKFENYFDRVQGGASREELIDLREGLQIDRDIQNLRVAVDGAREGAERVRDIVEDLRRLSADGSGSMTEFDLVETARIAVNWILRGSKRDVRVEFSGDSSITVLGRPGHIQQIVMNLFQNAIDAVSHIDNGAVSIRHAVEGGFAILEVQDNGSGISEADASMIFDPFYTTKDVGQGTGLGLSISYKIAEEHGGELKLGQATLGGACIRLELPLAKEATTHQSMDMRPEGQEPQP